MKITETRMYKKKSNLFKIMSFALVIAMLVNLWDMTVAAASISENTIDFPNGDNTALPDMETVSENQANDNLNETEETVSGQNLQSSFQAGAYYPANPVHHCTKKNDGTDYTDFSYVYFGSYPQTEVTDIATKMAIEEKIEKSGITDDSCIDVWVKGQKYRRISKKSTNTSRYFGYNTYRYFKWERIKWKVLQNDGNTLFLVSDQVLDCKTYYEDGGSITWEGSDIRSWLNKDFYETAFNSKEQAAILLQNVENDDYLTVDGGNNTEDKIYLLSMGEALNENYGFCSGYSIQTVSRRYKPTHYASARGSEIWESDDCAGNCSWWLRSPGAYSHMASVVCYDGGLQEWGVSITNTGICPALRISLSSDRWYMTNDGTSGEGGEEKIPVEADTNENTSGEKVSQKVTKLTISGPSKKLAAGKKVSLSLQVMPENASNKKVIWKSSNQKYATVSSNGKVTLKKAGIGKNVTITATAQDGSGIKASYKFKIMKHAVKSIKLTASKKTLQAGKSMTIKTSIKTTGSSVNKTVKWSSSNIKYATVNSKGKVTAKKAGKGKTVTITARSTDGSNKKSSIKIKIK